jgi:hypothetical protein
MMRRYILDVMCSRFLRPLVDDLFLQDRTSIGMLQRSGDDILDLESPEL